MYGWWIDTSDIECYSISNNSKWFANVEFDRCNSSESKFSYLTISFNECAFIESCHGCFHCWHHHIASATIPNAIHTIYLYRIYFPSSLPSHDVRNTTKTLNKFASSESEKRFYWTNARGAQHYFVYTPDIKFYIENERLISIPLKQQKNMNGSNGNITNKLIWNLRIFCLYPVSMYIILC